MSDIKPIKSTVIPIIPPGYASVVAQSAIMKAANLKNKEIYCQDEQLPVVQKNYKLTPSVDKLTGAPIK